MSVKKLIEELKNFDQRTEVVVHHNGMYRFKVVKGSICGEPAVWIMTDCKR